MNRVNALNAAKKRLHLSNNDFDDILEAFFENAVDRLYPKLQKEVASEEVTPTVDSYGEAVVDLAALELDDARMVEAMTSGHWFSAPNIFRHATNLRVRDLPTDTTMLRVYGLTKYTVVNDVVDLPGVFELPVIWYMMSDFFDHLAGNKSNFSAYTQQAGGNAMEDMRDQAQYYEIKADNFIDDKAQLYGS
jgi:hypothetical protein